jgi:hypothetical protein
MANSAVAADDFEDCRAFVFVHGAASRAQFFCQFKQYNQNAIERAKECRAVIGDELTKQALKDGFDAFNETTKKLKKKAACDQAISTFSQFLRK